METKNRIKKFCPFCMCEHEIRIVREREQTIFKGVEVEFDALYEYCENCDEYSSTEEMMTANDISMKNAYREKVGLLTGPEIIAIRNKYGISQSDLCTILGWGEKTITRYEGHQVQTAAHDSILRKIDIDPEWFLKLLDKAENRFSHEAFSKYRSKAAALFAENQDHYLRKSIEARYSQFEGNAESCGGISLNLNKVIEVIRYLANSPKVTNLYKVKLMKMLWYSDFLCCKRHGVSLMGLVYTAKPLGAVPIAHDSIIDLHGVSFEEVDFGNGTAYRFLPTSDTEYPDLSEDDLSVLNTIIDFFGNSSKDQIVNAMHSEEAYIKTSPDAVISYKYAGGLSLS